MALTDEQIAQEEKFLAGMPALTSRRFFLPPVWGSGVPILMRGPFRGLVSDNVFYAAFSNRLSCRLRSPLWCSSPWSA